MYDGPVEEDMVRSVAGRRGSTDGRGRGGCEERRDGSMGVGVTDGPAVVVADAVPVAVEVIGGSCGLNSWLRTAAAPRVPPREAGAIGTGCAGPGW